MTVCQVLLEHCDNWNGNFALLNATWKGVVKLLTSFSFMKSSTAMSMAVSLCLQEAQRSADGLWNVVTQEVLFN